MARSRNKLTPSLKRRIKLALTIYFVFFLLIGIMVAGVMSDDASRSALCTELAEDQDAMEFFEFCSSDQIETIQYVDVIGIFIFIFFISILWVALVAYFFDWVLWTGLEWDLGFWNLFNTILWINFLFILFL